MQKSFGDRIHRVLFHASGYVSCSHSARLKAYEASIANGPPKIRCVSSPTRRSSSVAASAHRWSCQLIAGCTGTSSASTNTCVLTCEQMPIAATFASGATRASVSRHALSPTR